MTSTTNQPRSVIPFILLFLFLISGSVSRAADVTWTGGSLTSGNWNDAANWSALPASGDNLTFSGALQTVNTNDFTGFSAGSLQFANGDFSIYGTNALTLGGVTSAAGNNMLFTPVTLSAPQNFNVGVGSLLTLSNTLALGGTLTLSGYGDLTVSGVISGTGGIIHNGLGNLTLFGLNTLSGGITVNSGILYAAAANSGSGACGNSAVVVNNGGTLRASGNNNCLFGPSAPSGKTLLINGGGTVDMQTALTCHLVALVLNGGTLYAPAPNGQWGNWNFDFGVSTLTNGSFSTISGGNAALTQIGGTVFNIGAGDTVAVSAVLAKTSSAVDNGLIKSGAGVLDLQVENTYTSPTTINAGVLRLSTPNAIGYSPTVRLNAGSFLDVGYAGFSVGTNQTLFGSGNVIGAAMDNNPGGKIVPGTAGTAGTLSMESLTLNGNVTLSFDLANVTTVGGGVNDLLVVTNLTLASGVTNPVVFNFLNVAPLVPGTYTLIQYQTGPAAGPVYTLAASASRYTYAFTSDGSSIKVTVGGTPATLTWKGDGVTNVWDLTTTRDWLKNGSILDVFYQSDYVLFDDTGSTQPSVNIVAGVNPTTATVNATKDYTFAGTGKLTGSASLIKSNTGTLLLLTDNDNVGSTRIEGGTVAVGNGGANGSPGAGNITNNATLIFNRSDSPTLPGSLNGTGKIVKFGAGTVTTLSAHPFTGSLTISNGGVKFGNAQTDVAGFAGAITNYGTLDIEGTNTVVLPGPIVGLGTVQLYGTNNVRLNSVQLDGTGTLQIGNNSAGTTSGVRPVLSIGNGDNVTVGRLMVGQTASYNGNVTQTGGVLTITDATEGEGPFRLGHYGTENSTYTMSGGYLVITSGPNARISLGIDGTGIWNMLGGTAMVSRIEINERSATGNGSLNLTNGTILIGAGGITNIAPYTNIWAGGTIGSMANWLGIGTNTLAGMVTFDTGPFAVTLSGTCMGTGGLNKTGAGSLSLNGTSYSTGPLTVQNGTLQGSGTFAGPITVQSGAALSAGGTFATGTFTVTDATLNPGANLVIDLSSTAATSDSLTVKGTLTLNSTPVSFNFLGGTPFLGSPYTIVTNPLPRSGSLTYVNPTRYAVNLDQSQANRIQVTFSGSNAGLVWKGNANNLWDVNSTANWLNGNVASTYYQADAVVFDATGLGTPNVNLASGMNPASVTVNAAGDYAFSGAAIATLGNLMKSGSGKLTLANNNAFANTVVNDGSLQVGNGGTSGTLAGNVQVYSSLVFNHADTLFASNFISGPGTVTQAGSGLLMVLGNSSYYGGTLVNPGTAVQVGNGLAFDSGLLGVGPINNQGSITYFRNGSPTLAAQHNGPGALNFLGVNVIGQSSYQLAATNTFTGPVTVSNARLWSAIGGLGYGNPASITLQQGSALYAVAAAYNNVCNVPLVLSGTGWLENAGLLGALRLQGGMNWAGPITLAGNTRVSCWSDAASNVISGTITGSYELETGINASGFLSLAPTGPNSFSALRVSPGNLWLDNANAMPAGIPLIINGGTLKLNGQNVSVTDLGSPVAGGIQNGSASAPATLTVNPSSDAVFTGLLADGGPQTLALIKNGKATLALTALNTNQGGVLVNGGTLALRAGGGSGAIRGNVVMQPGTLLLSQNGDSIGYSGGVNQVTNLVLNGASLIHTPAGNLSLWNNLAIHLTGAYMAATNTATLPSTGARLDLGAGAWIDVLPSSVPSVIGGGNLYLRQTDTRFDVADGAAADDLLVTAPITQAGAGNGITKNGAGRMKVMNIFGVGGTVTVNGGSLVLGSDASSLTNSTTVIRGGATLDVSAAGGLTLASGQTLQGASTLGTLTVVGNVSLTGGNLKVKLSNSTTVGGGVNDLIQINGDVSLNDSAPTIVNFTFPNGAPSTSGVYTILKCTGSLTGSAAGLTNSAGDTVATFTVDTAAREVRVTFKVPAQSLVWQGGDPMGNNWDFTSSSVNWWNGTASTNFYQLDSVRFDDSRTTVNTTVYINDPVTPTSMTVDSANPYTFTTGTGTGKLTGNTSITKNNTGTMTLGLVNDFTGTVTVNGGVLMLENGTTTVPLGTGGNKVTVNSGSTFDFNGNTAGNNTTRGYEFSIAGSGPDGTGALVNNGAGIAGNANVSNLTLTANAVMGGGYRFDIGTGQTNMAVKGNGFTLIKSGSNEMSFRAETVSNLAALIITNGDLYHENFDRTNSWDIAITNYAKSGGRLGSYANRTHAFPIVLDGGVIYNRTASAGTPNWLGPLQIASGSEFNNGAAQRFYGPIGGPGTMWVNGGVGVLTITNANTYSGGTVISNAPITTAGADATAGSAAVIMTHPGALGTGPITLNGTAYASLLTNATFFNANVLRAVEFNFSGPATVANNIVLPTTTVANASLHGRDNTQIVNLTGQITGGFTGFTNWIDFGTAATSGTLRYANNANSFLGTISVFRGILAITGNGALGNSANVLRLNTGGLRFDAPNINLAHNLYLSAGSTAYLIGDNNGDGVPETVNNATLSGIISGGSALTVRGTNGVLTLTGANTMTSGYELLEPVTLQVASGANLGTAAAYVAIKGGSTFRYTGTGAETWTRNLWVDNAALGGGTIDIPNASASIVWNAGGNINQNLTKTGAGALTIGRDIGGNAVVTVNGGTLTLANATSYLGPTFVNAGTLFVNGSIPAANDLVVASGATLGGTGTINCPVEMQLGSLLTPGVNGIGTLKIASPLVLSPTTATTMEIDGTAGTSDQVASLSTVTYGGTLTVNNLTGTPAVGAKFTLFSAIDRLGGFASVTLPSLPAPLYWTNTLALDGSIAVASSAPPVNTSRTNLNLVVSGGNLNLSWPADHTGWYLQVQTNALSVGLVNNPSAWSTWPNSSTTNFVSVPIDTVKGTVYFRMVITNAP